MEHSQKIVQVKEIVRVCEISEKRLTKSTYCNRRKEREYLKTERNEVMMIYRPVSELLVAFHLSLIILMLSCLDYILKENKLS